MNTRSTWGGTRLVVLIMAALWVAALAGRANGQAPNAPPPTAAPRIPLAVIPFTGSATGVPEGFGDALSEAVRHGLRQVRAVRLVDSEGIVASGQRVNVSVADVLTDEAALRLARDLQVLGLLTGTYALDGDTLKVQARIADNGGGQVGHVIVGEEVVGPLSDFLAVASPEQRGYFVFTAIRNPLDDAVSDYFKYLTDHRARYSRPLPRGRWRPIAGTRPPSHAA